MQMRKKTLYFIFVKILFPLSYIINAYMLFFEQLNKLEYIICISILGFCSFILGVQIHEYYYSFKQKQRKKNYLTRKVMVEKFVGLADIQYKQNVFLGNCIYVDRQNYNLILKYRKKCYQVFDNVQIIIIMK